MNTQSAASSFSKFLCVFLAVAVAFAFMPSPAFAASSKSVSKQTFTTKSATVHKKAVTIKKGTTKLTYKAGVGYVKFKAKKTKTYSFTVSSVKSKKFSSATYVSFYTKSAYKSKSLASKKVSTKGGKNNTLWLSCNGYSHSGKLIYRPLATRTGKVKLKKGQWIYLYLGNESGGKTTLTMKVS